MKNSNAFWNVILRWGGLNGLVIAATSIIGMLIVGDPASMLKNTSTQNMIQSVALLGFGIYCYYMVIQDYKKEIGDSNITMNEAVKLVFAKAVFAGLIYFVVYYVYIAFVDTSMIDFVNTQMEEQLIENGLEDEELEKALEMSKTMANPFFIAFSGTMVYKLAGAIFLGLPISYMTTKQ